MPRKGSFCWQPGERSMARAWPALAVLVMAPALSSSLLPPLAPGCLCVPGVEHRWCHYFGVLFLTIIRKLHCRLRVPSLAPSLHVKRPAVRGTAVWWHHRGREPSTGLQDRCCLLGVEGKDLLLTALPWPPCGGREMSRSCREPGPEVPEIKQGDASVLVFTEGMGVGRLFCFYFCFKCWPKVRKEAWGYGWRRTDGVGCPLAIRVWGEEKGAGPKCQVSA